MNETQQDQKIQQDVNRVVKNLNTLKDDSVVRANMVGENLAQYPENVASWVNTGVATLSAEFEKVKDDAAEKVAKATTTVKKNVGDSLVQYNASANEAAMKLPGNVCVMARKYPWVAISFALVAGFVLRGVFIPRRSFPG